MYRLFYDFKTNGDVLFLVYEPETEPDTIKEGSNVTGLFKEGRFIGANFFQIGEVVKLKTSGMIVTPDDALIDVLNTILKQNGLPELPYCRDSGYKVAKIVALEEHPLDEKAQIVTLSLGDRKIETFSRYPNLEVGKNVVVALDGTIKFDGTTFHASIIRNIHHDADIASGKELHLNEDYKNAFVVEGEKEGNDFFLASF